MSANTETEGTVSNEKQKCGIVGLLDNHATLVVVDTIKKQPVKKATMPVRLSSYYEDDERSERLERLERLEHRHTQNYESWRQTEMYDNDD